jgi:hypothetical protein
MIRRLLAALALTVAAGGLAAAPAAAAGPSASDWCNRYKPHSGDRLWPGIAYWYAMTPGMVTARCIAYEGSYPNGVTRLHYYHVTIWDQDGDGDVDASWWTPLNPYTW